MNIGLIGFGSMGKTHAYAVHNLNYFFGDGISARIAGVCTAHRETSEKAAREYGFDVAVTDEDELIYSPDIDIIDICTPNILHFETAKKAVIAGKHVYCEKPLAVTPEQADMLASLAAENGVTAQVVFNNRFMSGVMRAKEIISGGLIGNVISFRCEYLHSSCTDLSRNAGWKQDRDICGGGTLYDLGSHVIDLMTWLCGRMTRVAGHSQIVCPTHTDMGGNPWTTNADEAFYMTAETEGGAVGTMEFSKVALGTNDDLAFEIYGRRGSLRFSLMEPDWLYFYDATAGDGALGGTRGFTRIECVGRYPGMVFPSPKAPAGWLYGHLNSMYAFLSAVAENKPFSPSRSVGEGAAVQAVIAAVSAHPLEFGTVPPC